MSSPAGRRTALVTGGGRGLGRDITLALVQHGWAVAVTGRDPASLDVVVADGAALALPGDATDRRAVQEAVLLAEAELGPLDLLVANAGRFATGGLLWEIDPDEWWRDVEVNLRGVQLALWAALPGMVARGAGRVVALGSGFGNTASPHGSGYGVGKTAVVEGLAQRIVAGDVADSLKGKRLVSLDLSKRQESTSTITAVRAFAWASNVLGIALPEMYIMDNVPGGVAAVQAWSPTTAIGPEVLNNVGVTEVIYIASRHLAYYRPEHYPLVFFPSLGEFTQLFLAALKLGMPDIPIAANEGVAKLRAQLARLLEDAEKVELVKAAKAIEAKGGKVDLNAYIRGVELTAHRAAFVLAADVHVAMRRIGTEQRAIADVTADDRRHDLLAYLASDGLANVRARLVSSVKAAPSKPPLARASAS